VIVVSIVQFHVFIYILKGNLLCMAKFGASSGHV